MTYAALAALLTLLQQCSQHAFYLSQHICMILCIKKKKPYFAVAAKQGKKGSNCGVIQEG